jgi:cholinesterase
MIRVVSALLTGVSGLALFSSQEPGQSVKTTSGSVIGHVAKNQPNVSEYLGIRFAETTGGTNRFLPPKKYTGAGTFQASNFVSTQENKLAVLLTSSGPVSMDMQLLPTSTDSLSASACPFSVGDLAGATLSTMFGKWFGAFGESLGASMGSILGGYAGSMGSMGEDCLFVNVWTPPKTNNAKKAVMVWIFGGGFSLGDSSTPMYNGEHVAANQDVIVVSFNYRTNMFGFPGAPNLKQLNPALIDQRLALEWIDDNIEAFGGDKSRITLFGESAGASSVDYYAYAWADKKPIVTAMIIQSGTAFMSGPFAPPALEKRHDAWYQTMEKLGCGTRAEDQNKVLVCAQGKSMKEVQDAMPKAQGFQAVVGYFGPTVDNETIFHDVYERAKSGRFIQVVWFINLSALEKS